MYKRLLTLILLVALVPFISNAQVSKPQRAKKMKKATVVTGENVRLPIVLDQKAPVLGKTVTGDVIGYTYYDYLSNGAPGDHIIRFADGTIAVGVMGAIETGAMPSRGSYYQYYDGTKWLDTTGTWRRVEGSRKGYPNLAAFLTSKNSMFISHMGAAFTLDQGADPSVPSWSTINIPETGDWTWPTIAADDMGGTAQNIYVTAGGDPTVPLPFVRSTDAGENWSAPKNLIDTNSVEWVNDYVGGGANDYHIAARNGKVAVLNFPSVGNVTLYVSEDQGQTFTTKTIYDFIDVDTSLDTRVPFDTNFFPARTWKALDIPVVDGTGDVHIDKNGVIHCAWGTYQMYYEIVLDDNGNADRDSLGRLQRSFTYSDYSPLTGIYYWRSDWGDAAPIRAFVPSAQMTDISLADTVGGGVPVSRNRALDVSLMGMPSIGTDANGNVFIVFQGFKANDLQTYTITDGTELAAYGHAYITKSVDGGRSFTTPQDVFGPDITKEDVQFPVIADNVTDSVHILVLNDKDAGNAIQYAPPHPVNRALFVYKALSSIAVNVNDKIADSKSYRLGQNYPNPFNPSTKINFSLAEKSMVTLKVYDMLGREVAVLVNGEMPAGSHSANFNAANLATGMYVYTLKANNFTSTKKMMFIK